MYDTDEFVVLIYDVIRFILMTSSRKLCMMIRKVDLTLGYSHSNIKVSFIIALPSKSVVRRCSVKKIFLKTSQNSQENTCARVSFFNKVAAFRTATLLKKRLWHKCFPVNFAKFLRTPFFTGHLWWLLLCLLPN